MTSSGKEVVLERTQWRRLTFFWRDRWDFTAQCMAVETPRRSLTTFLKIDTSLHKCSTILNPVVSAFSLDLHSIFFSSATSANKEAKIESYQWSSEFWHIRFYYFNDRLPNLKCAQFNFIIHWTHTYMYIFGWSDCFKKRLGKII